jgi:hypothetical protein
VCIHPFL